MISSHSNFRIVAPNHYLSRRANTLLNSDSLALVLQMPINQLLQLLIPDRTQPPSKAPTVQMEFYMRTKIIKRTDPSSPRRCRLRSQWTVEDRFESPQKPIHLIHRACLVNESLSLSSINLICHYLIKSFAPHSPTPLIQFVFYDKIQFFPVNLTVARINPFYVSIYVRHSSLVAQPIQARVRHKSINQPKQLLIRFVNSTHRLISDDRT